MRPLLVAIALTVSLAAQAEAGDAVVLLEETRTREPGKKQPAVRHVALVKNTSSEGVRGLRVTVELYDFFGKLLWARTTIPAPSSLKPGDTATVSLLTPQLDAYRKTRYRFDYHSDTSKRR
jgi:hypothetical protein